MKRRMWAGAAVAALLYLARGAAWGGHGWAGLAAPVSPGGWPPPLALASAVTPSPLRGAVEVVLLLLCACLVAANAGRLVEVTSGARIPPPLASALSGLLLPLDDPFAALAPALFGAAALLGLAAAVASHLTRRPEYPLLRLLTWSLVLGLTGADWAVAALAAGLLLAPAGRGREGARIEATVVVTAAGGAWALLLWLLALPLLPPGGPAVAAPAGVLLPVAGAAVITLLVTLLLLLPGRLPYGVAAAGALPALVAVADVLAAGLGLTYWSAPAGVAALAALPAFAALAMRTRSGEEGLMMGPANG